MIRFFSVLCCLFFTLTACSFVSDAPKEIGPLPELSCVAVLPTAIPAGRNEALSAARKKSLLEGAAFFDSVLAEELGDRAEFIVLTENQLDAILGDSWGGRIQQVRDVGKATGCGAILKTSLSRYRERIGSEMSAETSASAAFSMQLTGVERGDVLWSTSFDETQKALFDDIFSFDKAQKRGFKWVSVQDLSRDGLRSRLQKFPYFLKVDGE
ncbi:MAG: hypothetical protein JKY62_13560 [Desulfocapsa sp.]|uniref:Lipoprotein n=1 Tax=Desulfotalea psychrophila TaxID=84980 RepID=A0ABS3AWQ8_9BACT|nr:hypothetical protein [Desulfocapsa sp.]MBN4068327.1 hypothetical protein [Desulfotalea psychrophila]